MVECEKVENSILEQRGCYFTIRVLAFLIGEIELGGKKKRENWMMCFQSLHSGFHPLFLGPLWFVIRHRQSH